VVRVDLTAGIVRILAPGGTTAGTGFVVTAGGLIATCAHVVSAAGAGPGDVVRVVFYATGKEREAQVESAWWRGANTQDVAILCLDGSLPKEAAPLDLGAAEESADHAFRAFGYPAIGDIEGLWARGTIRGLVRDARGQKMLQLASAEIDQGASGGPVFDEMRRRVVGMVTATYYPNRTTKHRDTSFATPTETLRAVCPVLQLSDLCPYQGLAAFAKDRAEFFFGREKLVANLVDHLRGNPRFLAIVGPSGSGKSSVVQAGLFAALRRGEVPGSESWHTLTFRPGGDPYAGLVRAGLEVTPQADPQTAVRAFLDRHPETGRLVLFADQFEELFTLCPEQIREPFLAHLLRLLECELPVTVILALRADFYEPLLHHPPLVEWLTLGQVNVTAMDAEGLRSAVKPPAEAVGLGFEAGLVDIIVEDASQARHPLPLLEAALTQLWRQRKEGVLTHAAYQRVGRVPGAISQWAEDRYSGLGRENQSLAQRVLTRLVYYGPEGSTDLRQRRSLAELVAHPEEQEAIHGLVQRLADARLLVTDWDPRTGEETVELIHDALLWEWRRLRQWRVEQRDFYLWRQRLGERLRDWEDKERDEGTLLRGALLAEAKRWLRVQPDDLNPRDKAYIQESLALRKRIFRRIVGGSFLVLAILYLWLGASYYLSASGSTIVVRAGHPGLKLLPGFDHVAVVTDASLRDMENSTPVSGERLGGLWLRRGGGYAYWGEQLFSRLKDAKAGVAYWRVGDAEQAFARLAQGVASGDVASVKTLGYLALQSKAAVGPAIDTLILALQGDATLREATLTALAVVRDTQPDATATQLASLTARLHTTSGTETVAVAEAIGVLGAHDRSVSRFVLTELLIVLRAGSDTGVQLAVARALNDILARNPDLLPAAVPDVAWFASRRQGEVRRAFIAILGIPSPLDPAAQDLALQATVQALADKDPATRSAGVTTLGRLISGAPPRSATYLPALLAMADDRDGGVRAATVDALVSLPPGLAAQTVVLEKIRSLVREDEDHNVRYRATQALAEIHDSGSRSAIVETLVAATGDVYDLVRWGAVHALVEMGVARAAQAGQFKDALWAALDDQSPDVRQEAAQGLLLLADQVEGDLTRALDEFIRALTSDDWRRAQEAEQLAQRFAEAVPGAAITVVAGLPPFALQADEFAVRRITDFLVATGENQPRALAGIVLALADLLGMDETAGEADRALWQLGSQPAVNLEPALASLFERLDSTSPVERETAARAIGWVSAAHGDLASEAVVELSARFTDPALPVRAAVAFSLGMTGRKQPEAVQLALETLAGCLVSEHLMVRVACANALAEIAAGERPPIDVIAPPLIAALPDPSPEIRQEAAKGLSNLVEKAPEATQAAIEPLRALLSTELDPEARLTFASALGILDGQDSEAANQVVTIAKADLTGSDTGLREQAIWVLRDLGKHQPTATNQTTEALRPVLADPDPLLRRKAILAIRDIGISDALSAEVALAALEAALTHPDSQTRWDAIGNGIAPIVRFQPTSAASAVSLLHDFVDSEASFADAAYSVQSQAWETLTASYAVLAADRPEILWPLLISGSAGERAVGQEALFLAIAGRADLMVEVGGKLEALGHNTRPHVRQSAALAKEMIAITQRTQDYLSHPADAKRWYEVLEWLPDVGVDAARDHAQREVRERYDVD
jgi:HEAT repeat protein